MEKHKIVKILSLNDPDKKLRNNMFLDTSKDQFKVLKIKTFYVFISIKM